jgi:carbon monoxide dehydrogenase subunit G
MAHVSESIEVQCPVGEVYNQWTQFEEFPRFMSGIEQVTQTDDTHLHWKANIAGRSAEWDAEITEQVPDQVIAWQAIDGATNSGRVQFQGSDGQTSISVEMDVEPQSGVERAADMIGILQQLGARRSQPLQAADRVARGGVRRLARRGQRRRDAVLIRAALAEALGCEWGGGPPPPHSWLCLHEASSIREDVVVGLIRRSNNPMLVRGSD